MTTAADAHTRQVLTNAACWVDHTGDVEIAVADALVRLAEAREAPSPGRLRSTRDAIRDIGAMTRDNPRQGARVARALAIVDRSGEGDGPPGSLAELRDVFLEMRADETALLDFRREAERRARTTSETALAIGSLVTMVLGLLFAWTVQRELSSRRREAAALRELSLRDELTGLANRRAFLARAAELVAGGERFAVVYADLNGLKGINDTLGHEHGDRAIRDAASILRGLLRPGDLVARLGGDEFAALALRPSPNALESVPRRVREAFAAHNERNAGGAFPLSISVGCSCFDPSAPRALVELLADADRAMYASKRASRPPPSGRRVREERGAREDRAHVSAARLM